MAAAPAAARLPIIVSVMAASCMITLDMTIANVALPHMQGSVSASHDQIAWVLTSYLVAQALTTPLTGWLSGRLGRKRLVLVSIAGFTTFSMLCGVADSLPQLVAFRFFQGMFGAPLTPLSQAVMLDIHPPDKHGQAMAVWGIGSILGPIGGPILGGFLTDQLSWRWVFFINAPVGILSLIGCLLFLPSTLKDEQRNFDFIGFAALLVFIGSLQLMLDRGPGEDWFAATEVWTYLIVGAMALWVFIFHTLTVEHPFFDRRLMSDRNFVTASLFGFVVGVLLFSSTALLPPLMQGLMGFSALSSGILSVPREIGALAAMFVAGRIVGLVDTRIILAFGMTLAGVAAWQMSRFDLMMGEQPLVIAGLIQGFGMGVMFVPMNTLAFATLPQTLRAEGSTVNTIVRSMGASVGISVMQGLSVTNSQAAHAGLAARINPTDPVVAAGLPPAFDPGTVAGLTILNNEISRQAMMIAYLNDFRVMVVLMVCCIPLLLMMRPPKGRPLEVAHVALD